MARFPIAYGNIPNFPLTPIVDTQGAVKGVAIQNVSSVDAYVGEDPTRLQVVPASGTPSVGFHFPPDAPPPSWFILPFFNGKLYARAGAAGAQLEVLVYDVC